ncbi:unnamed protein product [Adineta ricciae]|uniref:Uncharacterized protein n=1 Tax=Adineta ricciae TaxID=249248 RepID=A0A816EH53_ADIRI|nr:unnamed protein product [Adineta ricciae]
MGLEKEINLPVPSERSPSTVPCARCPLIFCLRHLAEHQIAIGKEHKHLISSIDNRYESCQQLDEWQTNMIENINRVKNEVHTAYEQYDEESNKRKETILNDCDENEMSLKEISIKLEQALHTLESSRLELIISKINLIIHLMKPNLNPSIPFNSQSGSHIDLDRFLTTSTAAFTLDYDSSVIATSSKYLLSYKSSSNCYFKDICANGESIVVVHNLGTSLDDVIEHYSTNQMIQRCWKPDLFFDEINMKDILWKSFAFE